MLFSNSPSCFVDFSSFLVEDWTSALSSYNLLQVDILNTFLGNSKTMHLHHCSKAKNWRNNFTIKPHTLHKKCPYSELFWPLFSRIWTEVSLRILSESGRDTSVRMWENMDQNISEFGHFSHSDISYKTRTLLNVCPTSFNFTSQVIPHSITQNKMLRFFK